MTVLSPLSRPIVEIIRRRVSCRNYVPGGLALDSLARLQEHLRQLPAPPFAPACRFAVVETEDVGPKKLGTYGNVAGATRFVAGAVEQGTRDLENYGYLLEEIILWATDQGLGTCWLGGTFAQGAFARAVGLKPGERLPAVTPVGTAAADRSLRERMVRWQAGSEHRKPWSELFFHDSPGNPATEASAGDYATVLEMVRLAPSASNHQPWRILKEYNRPVFHVYLQRNPVYTAAAKTFAPAGDIQRLDIGIALCHFEWAAREAKLKGQWTVLAAPPKYPKTEYVVSWNGLTPRP
jgi:nitroreductase